MPDDLGIKLVQAGWLQDSDLDTREPGAADGPWLAEKVRLGGDPWALAHIFEREGFGPIVVEDEFERAERRWTRELGLEILRTYLVHPLARTARGLEVAMFVPTDVATRNALQPDRTARGRPSRAPRGARHPRAARRHRRGRSTARTNQAALRRAAPAQ
jgi:Type II secretion system (T2SS), protein E, N-terminal domain